MLTKTQKKLLDTMMDLNLTKDTEMIIASNLTTKKQQQEMIDYLIHWKDIITDHQALQHASKIVMRSKEQ